MPDQSQGACQSIEDAGALGVVFSKEHFNGNVKEALEVYEQVRKPRGTKVQAASARARVNINERIGTYFCLDNKKTQTADSIGTGFSSNTDNKLYEVQGDADTLTIDEMNR